MLNVIHKAGKILPAFLLLIFSLLFPSGANGQDAAFAPEDDLYDDGFFFVYYTGITIVGTLQTRQ
jgi:hypothetical protein